MNFLTRRSCLLGPAGCVVRSAVLPFAKSRPVAGQFQRSFMWWLIAMAVLANLGVTLHAEDWPAWRGPGGQGHSTEKNLPLKWSKTENIKWKTPLAEVGISTPIVFRDRVFLTQATKSGATRSLLCFAKADGKLLWQRDVTFEGKEPKDNSGGYCNASPVTDGERVVVSFGSAGMHCFDFHGQALWQRTDLGTWKHRFGNGSSPVLHQNLALLWCGPNERPGRTWLLAVDKLTGQTVWESDDPRGGSSWDTPLIAKVNGQDQLFLSVEGRLKGLDPKTGKELWFCEGRAMQVHTSTLYGKGVAVVTDGRMQGAFAVKLGGSGNLTTNRLWHHLKVPYRIGSGVIVGDHFYTLEQLGEPHCYELTTGEEVWQADKLPGSESYSSMVHADGRLYVNNTRGDTFVFAASPKYELLATNSLGEATKASMAVSGGEFFLRTAKTLWCVSEKK